MVAVLEMAYNLQNDYCGMIFAGWARLRASLSSRTADDAAVGMLVRESRGVLWEVVFTLRHR